MPGGVITSSRDRAPRIHGVGYQVRVEYVVHVHNGHGRRTGKSLAKVVLVREAQALQQ